MIDKTTSRVILGLLGTACILIKAFAWYKTSHAASPDAGMRHNIYDEDVPRRSLIHISVKEHLRVIELAVESAAGRIQVVAGTGAVSYTHLDVYKRQIE